MGIFKDSSRIFFGKLFQQALRLLVFALQGCHSRIVQLLIVLLLAPLILLLDNQLDLEILLRVRVVTRGDIRTSVH